MEFLKKLLPLRQPVFWIALPLLVGGLSGILIRSALPRYALVTKPPLSPPAVLFPIVWSILYLLMGIASWLIAKSDSPDKYCALLLYLSQLAVNFFWPLIFFRLGFYLTAFFWLLLLLALVLLTARCFSSIDRNAGWLLLPYIVWLVFAAYLNLGVSLLN